MAREIKLPDPAEPWLDATDRAQRFLDSAKASVEHALNAMDAVRELRRQQEGKKRVGQLADSDMDLLRTAIVFAGAGLDATLKQLVKDALPDILEINARAKEKFRGFVERVLATGESTGAGHRTLVNVLLSDAESPREALLELYIGELCGSSLQSAEELDNVMGALGVVDGDLRKRVAAAKGSLYGKAGKTLLKQAFVARNEIVHELDLQVPEETGQRRRTPRMIQTTMNWTTEMLTIAQLVINDVSQQLDEEYER